MGLSLSISKNLSISIPGTLAEEDGEDGEYDEEGGEQAGLPPVTCHRRTEAD